MNNLQTSLLLIIFENVPIDQLFRRCKLVCKKWNQIINQKMQLNELVIRRTGIDRFIEKNAQTNYWYSNKRPINLNRTVILSKLDCFHNSSFRATFANLKFLKFTLDGCIEKISIRSLNTLSNLEHLEIESIYSEVNISPLYILKKPTLALSKLKFLKIPCIRNHKFKISSNKLENLICNRLKEFKVMKPDTVKMLEVKAYSCKVDTNSEDNLEHFGAFLNLKTLKLDGIDYLDKDLISKIPINLKELYLFHHFRINDSTIEKIKHILRKRNESKLKLKIFLQNCELKDASTFDENNFKEKDELKFIARNYNNLDQVTWCTNVDFIKLLAFFNQSIPNDFFKKILNVQQVFLNNTRFLNVDQQKDFYIFLINYPNLTKLFLHRQLFNQEFYDGLPGRFKLIEELFLYPKNNVKLNTQFVFRFELLRRFQTNQDLQISVAIELLNNLKLLRKFVFFNSANQIRINKCKNQLYELIYLKVINEKEKAEKYENLALNKLLRIIIIELYKDLEIIETKNQLNNRQKLKIKEIY